MSKRKHIVIIGASQLVLPAYRIARDELDLGTIAVDWDAEAPGMREADIALVCSTKDPDSVIAALKDLPRDVSVAGIFTCGADVEITVSAVAAAFGLPGIDPEVARCCNDKLAMHRHLDEAGFTGKAAYRVVRSADEAVSAATDLGLPVVIKPLGNCGSRGVQRLDRVDEVADAYRLAAEFNLDRGDEVLVEECLEGSKHTVEMITDGKDYHLISICDTHYISPRWPCETGLNITALPKQKQDEIFEFSESVAKAMGIDYNAHKIDVNVDADGKVTVIELTARLSGGFHCQYASPIAYGTHEIRAAMRLAVGGPLVLDDIAHQYERSAAVQAVFPEPGEVISVSGIDEALGCPGVEQVFVYAKVGDEVGPYLNSTDRVGFVIAGGKDAQEAVQNARNGVAKIQIQTRKRP